MYMTLSPTMITTEWAGVDDNIEIELIFSRLRWEPDDKESMLRLVTQNNLDCIFE